MDILIDKRIELQQIYEAEKKKANTYSYMRIFLFLLVVFFIVCLFKKINSLYFICLIFTFLLFILIVIIHKKIKINLIKIQTYINIIQKYEQRGDGDWQNEESIYLEDLDNFVKDLDIINGNSLLKYLNFTSSLGGKRKLIDSLCLKKEKITAKNILNKQQAIQELTEKKDFILEFQYLFSQIPDIKNIDFKEYFHLFQKENKVDNIIFFISILLSISTIISAILGLLKIIQLHYFLILMCVDLASSYIYMLARQKEFAELSMSARIFKNLKKIYNYLTTYNFETSQNKKLQEEINVGNKVLKKIIILSDINSLKLNIITYTFFNVFGSLNFVLLHMYHKLLKDKTKEFQKSIYALETFETNISLATIGIVKENICLPSVKDELKITSIKHPLLNESFCVSNDFSSKNMINIITGSNMSGKTSFMKTIGMNLILFYNGTYVNAKEMNAPIARIFTSINVKDDINNNISTFYGELLRIKNILDFSKNHQDKMIIFIDEIFKGTNYNDRIAGAKETIKQLSKLNCIVLLTTHDFELCDVNSKIKNYHFKEEYVGEKILFDYKIQNGPCKTTNAKYLMTLMGIIEKND